MALTSAVICGGIAAVVVPWLVETSGSDPLNGRLDGQLVHIPLGGGMELHWSWLVFCVVTLFCWGIFALARNGG